jgi:NAD(P)-dependent dehydrogenase (short-subunit alcohol dehydrogenase family)
MGVLDGKVAIITGAGRGLGRSHALLFASEGARVVVNDPGGDWDGTGEDSRPAQQVVEEIEAAGGQAVANFDNCADWKGAERLVQQAVDTFGTLDILVNNAGILRDKMSFNMEEADWDAVINVHLKGHFAPSHFAARYWRGRSKAGEPVYGRIINTSSDSGLYANAGQANYAAAKAGIASLALVMARELERMGVTVNAYAPRARTRLTVRTFEGFGATDDSGKFDELAPENVSPFICWLASPAAAQVSGRVFIVWGASVIQVSAWEQVSRIDNEGGRWTLEQLNSAAPELFTTTGLGVPPFQPVGLVDA